MDREDIAPVGYESLATENRQPSPHKERFWLRRKRLSLTVGLAVAMSAVVVAWWALGNRTSVGYVTEPVTRGSVERAVMATGSVNPVLTITVGTYVSGVIQEIYCDFNTRVVKGQLCARIDPRPYMTLVEQDRANVATARAQLVKDRANLSYAEANGRRFANLIAQHAVSQDAYDTAINARNQARAQVAFDEASIAQRSAELDAAQVNLDYTRIVSPVDGIVVSRNVTMGQTVAASFQTPTLFLIATDLAKMQVDTNVSESDVGGVRIGDRARFTVEAHPEKTFEGLVTQVRQAPQTVQNVVTYDAVITVSNPGFLLKPGMTATVRIITDSRDHVLRIPDQALRYAPGGLSSQTGGSPSQSQVFILRQGRPTAVAVKTGLDDDVHAELLAGSLHEGDHVIVSERSTHSTSGTGNPSRPAMRFP